MVNGAAHRRQVQLGTSKGDRIAVSSGLKPGDVVIIEGFHRLSEGTNITTR